MGRIYTTNDFIKKAKEIHGDKYDYSKVEYINAKTKVCIICSKHGEFLQNPHNHISNKSGCPKCSKNHNRYNTENFIDKVKCLYNDKYDYSLVKYVDGKTKIKIICPIHGIFEKSPMKHLQGQGCPKCSKTNASLKNRKTYNMFVTEAQKCHGNKYDYSKVNYVNANNKVCIICPKHGEFWQTPHHHLNGIGCPKCKMSKLETEIISMLNENNIKYIWQYKTKWLGRQSLDFYLPDYNIAIECQGEQHYEKVYYRQKEWNDEKAEAFLIQNKNRDLMKIKKCVENNVKLYYFSKKYYNTNIETFIDKNNLLTKILEKHEMG